MLNINLLSVLLASVVAFIVGFLMHGPVLGKLWMRLAGIVPTGDEKFSDMYGQMFMNLVVNFVTAYVLSIIYSIATISGYLNIGLWGGICSAFIIWIGFIVTGSSMDVIWMNKNKKLWIFEIFSSLLMLISMVVVIIFFK